MTQRSFVQMGTGLPEYLATIALMVPDCVPGTLRRPAGELS
ncbi:MAG TPA: hypothetical protein VIJ07_07870 [Dermatophilaceae bacterium]|jgi:hypothetical protein